MLCFVTSLIFGGITVGTGILGVTAGAEAARRLRKINNKADPLICATSMFISALCLYIALMVAQTNILSTFVSANLSIISRMSAGILGRIGRGRRRRGVAFAEFSVIF